MTHLEYFINVAFVTLGVGQSVQSRPLRQRNAKSSSEYSTKSHRTRMTHLIMTHILTNYD